MIKPLHSNLVVKLKEKSNMTKSGLVIIDSSSENKIQDGIVEFLPENDDIKLKVGDRVLFSQHAGTLIEIEKVKYLVLDYQEVIAILNKESEEELPRIDVSVNIPALMVH